MNLRSGIVLSVSSKHRLFLSLHIHHIKDCGAAIHKWPFRWLPSYVVYAAYSWQFCVWEKKRNYENKCKGVLVAKWTNALGELLAVSFEIRLVRNLKGHKILLTKFDLEEQNIDIQFTVDSSNTNNVLSFKIPSFFKFHGSLYEWISASGQFSISNLDVWSL